MPVASKEDAGAIPVGAADKNGGGRLQGDGTGEPAALTVTHWFDSGDDGQTYAATVRFSGKRIGVRGKPTARDAFVKDEVIQGIVPGSGPVSITTHVYGLAPGEWTVTADLIRGPRAADNPRATAGGRATRGHTLPRAAWSWRRWALSSGPFQPVHTRWAPLARLVSPPAVIPGSWFGLVLLGALVGLGIQSMLLARDQVSIVESLGITIAAAIAGLIGAKVRYVMLHPRTWRNSPAEGWAVDGFLVVLPLVVLAGLLAFDLPIGLFVDASTPALFFGVAIGRLGCFFTGCCAGQCTRSRWGIWSSDRRVGARRMPTQLLESAAGLVLGVATLTLYLLVRPAAQGIIFLGALAAYTLARRILLRLRSERQVLPSAARQT
ncbi:MAG: prolipoprotein diacylglyceryl transferase [Chloroflexi bacterium]|nr:prolipoprotein diacylglyceryl transferase [Chloroflexota bacterium]